eukprot:10034897-Prorocentrum_lima.AAC.1
MTSSLVGSEMCIRDRHLVGEMARRILDVFAAPPFSTLVPLANPAVTRERVNEIEDNGRHARDDADSDVA